MPILLAGATGVIGRQVVPVLAAAGHEVTGLARTPARLPDPVDPRHLARDLALTNRLRTQGTANLLAAADGARVIVQGVAYASDPAGPPVEDEDAPLWHHPPTQFAPVVAAEEEQARLVTWAGGLVLRLGHLYGPGSGFDPDGGGLTRRLCARRRASLFCFIHAHDVATAILAAVEHPAARGALNVVDDQPTLVHDWLPELAEVLGAPIPRHVPAWLARLFVGGWGWPT